MFSAKDIPKRIKTNKDKITYMEGQIRRHCESIYKNDINSLHSKWELGCKLSVLKTIVGKQGEDWKFYTYNVFPIIHIRTIRRAMKLAEIDLENVPEFKAAGENRLIALIELSNITDMRTFLQKNDFSLLYFYDLDKVMEFRDDIDDFLENSKRNLIKTSKTKRIIVAKILENITRTAKNFIVKVAEIKDYSEEGVKVTRRDFDKGIKEIQELLKQLQNLKYSIKKTKKSNRKKKQKSKIQLNLFK